MELKLCNEKGPSYIWENQPTTANILENFKKKIYWSIIDSGIQQSDSVYIYIF